MAIQCSTSCLENPHGQGSLAHTPPFTDMHTSLLTEHQANK